MASAPLNSLATAPPDEETRKAQKAESDRLDREIFTGLDNLLSVTDTKAILDKVNRMELLLQGLPECEAYRIKSSPLMRRDLEAVLKMTDNDQRKFFENNRTVRYAVQDFVKGRKLDALKSLESARKEYAGLLGEDSHYYLNCLDNELYCRIELQQGEEVKPLAEKLIFERCKRYGTNHPATANAYEFAAKGEMLRKNWALAGEYAATANNIRRVTKLPPLLCYSMEQLHIMSQIELGELKQARFLLSIFQDSRAELIKSNALVRAETFYLLVRLEEKTGRDAEAQIAEEQGLKAYLELLPRSDPRIQASLNHLRANLIRQKKWTALSSLETEWGLAPGRPKE